MTTQKLQEVIIRYRDYFTTQGIPAKDFSHDELPATDKEALAHCHGMLDSMGQFIKEDRVGKAFRWLGFIQGVLWRTGQFTLTQLRNHSRPDQKSQ